MAIELPTPWSLIPAERRLVPFTVADPAAGADWSARVPGGKLWVVQGFRATLTASATVASREPRVSITDGELQLGLLAMNTGSITASTARDVGGLLGGVPGGSGGTVGPSVGLPFIVLQPRWTFGMSTLAIQAGDQWSAIRGWAMEYEVRGARSEAEVLSDAIRELVRRAGMEDQVGGDPLARLIERLFGVGVRY